MYFLFILGVLIGFFYLKGRIDTLEEELRASRGEEVGVAHGGAALTPLESVAFTETALGSGPAQPVFTPKPRAENRFIMWLKKDFWVKVGALLLLIGFAWFVSYAFANNWIGPAGRITLGLVAGVAILTLGVWRIRTYIHQGGIFTVLGSSTILLTMFAARELYGFFTPASALLIMFLSVVFVAFVSVRYNSNNLALGVLALAGVAPLLTAASTPMIFELFTYLLVIVAGTLWVVRLRGWSNLTFAALIIVFLWGLPYMDKGLSFSERDVALVFSFVFTAIFFVANTLSILYQKKSPDSQAHLVTGLGTAAYLIAWIGIAVATEWQSLLYAAWMLVFAVGTYLIYRVGGNLKPFYLYGGTSVALLAAATAAELSGPVLAIAYAIEVGVIVMLAWFFTHDVHVSDRLSWLFLAPIALSLESIVSPLWRTSVLHVDFFALLLLTLVLLTTGVFLIERRQQDKNETSVGMVLVVLSVLYMLALVWLVFHTLFVDDLATMAALVVYTIAGISTYIAGHARESVALRVGGGILLGCVVARLLIVDIWQMEIAGRIITFFVIGALLISTAFMGKFKKQLGADTHNHNGV